MRLLTEATLHHNEPANYDDLLSELGFEVDKNRDLLASDMDGTMFKEDLGVLVFVQKLQDPTFWTYAPERFERLLLPAHYQKILKEGVSEIPVKDTEKIFRLTEEISRLYAQMKVRIKDGVQFTPEEAILSEFILRMLAFDDLLMTYDKYLMPLSGDMFLSRTRFFSGKNVSDVERLAASITTNSNGQILNIEGIEKNWEDLELSELSDDEKSRVIQLSTTIREDVFSIISRLISEKKFIHRNVVTANLLAIAKTAVRNSQYRSLFSHDGAVLASKLAKNGDKTLGPKMKEPPIYGGKKIEAIKKHKPNARLRVALGDTRGDIPMIAKSLENGGLGFFIADAKDPQKAAHYVKSSIQTTLNIENLSEKLGADWEQRMIYVLQED